MNLSVEHVLMFALVVCVFYYMRCNRVEGYDYMNDCMEKSTKGYFADHSDQIGGCERRGLYPNPKLYDFYVANSGKSVDEMVELINSGKKYPYNLRDPEECEKAVRECYDKYSN